MQDQKNCCIVLEISLFLKLAFLALKDFSKINDLLDTNLHTILILLNHL